MILNRDINRNINNRTHDKKLSQDKIIKSSLKEEKGSSNNKRI